MRGVLIGASAFLMTIGLCACAEAPVESADGDEVDLGTVGAKADGEPDRVAEVSLEAGEIKRFRIRATSFRATLQQETKIPVQLSAKHYEIDIYGAVDSAATVDAVADGTLRNWTLRVHNQGEERLEATVVVGVIPPVEPDPAESPTIELGIVSDIDKTVLPPAGSDDELPAPYPGVAALYHALELWDGGTPGDMYYVTARTAEGAEGLDVWMAEQGVPAGPIETGISGMPWVAQPEKVSDISAIFDANPDQVFVLFGDSSHRDPEVYREIIAKYPGRVVAGFINKVNNPNPDRLEGLHLIESYAQAAAILMKLEVIDEPTARQVISAAREDGLELTDDEVEDLIAAHQE